MGFIKFISGLLITAGLSSIIYGLLIQDIPVVITGVAFWFIAALVAIITTKLSWTTKSNEQVKLLREARGESYLDMLDILEEENSGQ